MSFLSKRKKKHGSKKNKNESETEIEEDTIRGSRMNHGTGRSRSFEGSYKEEDHWRQERRTHTSSFLKTGQLITAPFMSAVIVHLGHSPSDPPCHHHPAHRTGTYHYPEWRAGRHSLSKSSLSFVPSSLQHVVNENLLCIIRNCSKCLGYRCEQGNQHASELIHSL